jgi:predicted phosphodiesterase
MRIALISDIHGNLEALEAVFKDIDTRQIDETVCLGDIVGYGSDARECFELTEARCSIIVMGNHELFTVLPVATRDLGGAPGRGIERARETLTDKQLDRISRLPSTGEIAGATLVHASLNNPGDFQHIIGVGHAKKHFQFQETPLCFNGHTHSPIIFKKEKKRIDLCKPLDEIVSLNPQSKYLINVGSVGQPRDNEPAACYVIYDTEKCAVSFERVTYNVESAQQRFKVAGMHPSAISRIAIGQ